MTNPKEIKFKEALRDLRHARAELGVSDLRIQELSTAVEHAYREAVEHLEGKLEIAAMALVCAREDVPKEVCRLVERQTKDLIELAALHKVMDALPVCGTCDCARKATKYWESHGLVRFCCDACAPAGARPLSYTEALRSLQEKK